MKKTIQPSNLSGKIHPPPSKSISHRALILGAFSSSNIKIINLLKSEDVRATKEALGEMGAVFRQRDDIITVESNVQHNGNHINCLNSGTTLRLLTGIACLYEGKTTLQGDTSLNKRPMGPLIKALENLGATIHSNEHYPPLSVEKPINENVLECEISGNVSSQYISALLIMASLRNGVKTTINLIPPIVSQPYIDLTLEMLTQSGVIIEIQPTQYIVYGVSKYLGKNISVPSDFSSAAFYAVAGALPGNKITIENLSFEYSQADSKILDFIQLAGAKVSIEGTAVHIEGRDLRGFNADLANSPDLFPILCVLAANATGVSKLYNAKHLRIKETDRIKAMANNLNAVGIEYEELDDGIIITGGVVNGGVTLNSYHDHRIAMACAILGTSATKPIEIMNSNVVNVSYPGFYEELRKLSSNK